MNSVFLSRSEVKSEVEKAIRGSGFEWGPSKDAGIMAAWLAAHDQFFLGTILRVIDQFDQAENIDDDVKLGPTDAMVLAEYVTANGETWSGYVIGLRFLIAGMGIVSKEQHSSLILSIDDKVCAYAEGDDVYIDREITTADAHIDLIQKKFLDIPKALEPLKWSDQTAHPASESCWRRLNKLAWRVYVPETEQKRRSGAGAGDIDNS